MNLLPKKKKNEKKTIKIIKRAQFYCFTQDTKNFRIGTAFQHGIWAMTSIINALYCVQLQRWSFFILLWILSMISKDYQDHGYCSFCFWDFWNFCCCFTSLLGSNNHSQDHHHHYAWYSHEETPQPIMFRVFNNKHETFQLQVEDLLRMRVFYTLLFLCYTSFLPNLFFNYLVKVDMWSSF